MIGFGTWTRKLGGLVAVWLMALMFVGPTLDTVVCVDDGQPAAVSSDLIKADTTASADHGKSDRDQTVAAVCVHGHCHHGVNLGLTVPIARTAPVPMVVSHGLAGSSVYASLFPSGLERPPRA